MKDRNRLLFFAGLFSAILIGSNFMAVKLINVLGFSLPSAIICYPLCFVLSDIINEFWGLKTVKRVIVYTFIFNAVIVLFATITVFIPPDAYYEFNQDYKNIILGVPRILIASFVAFLISGFLNAYVFDRIRQGSKHLSLRSAISTLLGVIADSSIFITCAFAFTLPPMVVFMTIIGQILAKLILGIGLGTPLTVLIINQIKKRDENLSSQSANSSETDEQSVID